ncbi:UPF0688 protein C1orf174 homolog [Denticeps clupeoides]|uniref:Uncharacterized protein n=1 Tax=Denticeps clupeoides TaxID=299321 RepID=A0AAY4BCF1_9TELE|nr:UPF0688 protein C1orf174 homolog [Denticeps clupeoides]
MAVDGEGASALPERPFGACADGEERSRPAPRTEPGAKAARDAGDAGDAAGRRDKENAVKPTPAESSKKSAEGDPGIFLDEDSNQIYPVEQFFGNMDLIPDYPQKSTATKAESRREYRRRHYFAKEDSDEEGPV